MLAQACRKQTPMSARKSFSRANLLASKYRRNWNLGLYTYLVPAKREPLRDFSIGDQTFEIFDSSIGGQTFEESKRCTFANPVKCYIENMDSPGTFGRRFLLSKQYTYLKNIWKPLERKFDFHAPRRRATTLCALENAGCADSPVASGVWSDSSWFIVGRGPRTVPRHVWQSRGSCLYNLPPKPESAVKWTRGSQPIKK